VKAYTRTAARLACALGAALLGGCFSLSVQTPGEPLPPKEIRMRTETRQFAAQISERVQRVADAIGVQSSDAAVQADALRWKIGASVASRGAAYRSVPRLALVDTWTFAAQMDAFFRDGAGRQQFGAMPTRRTRRRRSPPTRARSPRATSTPRSSSAMARSSPGRSRTIRSPTSASRAPRCR